jgi:hypothetical protein
MCTAIPTILSDFIGVHEDINDPSRLAALGTLFRSRKDLYIDDTSDLLVIEELLNGDKLVHMFFKNPDALSRWRPKLSDPSVKTIFQSIPDHIIPQLQKTFSALGRSVDFSEPCHAYFAPDALVDEIAAALKKTGKESKESDDALATAIGVDTEMFTVGDIVEDDAPVINNAWKYADGKRTEELIRKNIRDRPSACIRQKSDGSLVSWVLVRYDGSLGMLGVSDKHRLKGLGKATMKAGIWRVKIWRDALIAEARSCGDENAIKLAQRMRPYCHVANYNTPSFSLMKSLGMEPSSCPLVTWISF